MKITTNRLRAIIMEEMTNMSTAEEAPTTESLNRKRICDQKCGQAPSRADLADLVADASDLAEWKKCYDGCMDQRSESSLAESISEDTKENLDAAVSVAYEEIRSTTQGAIDSGTWPAKEDLHGYVKTAMLDLVSAHIDELQSDEPGEEISDDETLYVSAPKGGHVPKTWER
jgi:hypothetical protein